MAEKYSSWPGANTSPPDYQYTEVILYYPHQKGNGYWKSQNGNKILKHMVW